MVGFGPALQLSRRKGWESAYLDYENLKLLLTQIEAVYEENDTTGGALCQSQQNNHEEYYVTGLGGFGYDNGKICYDTTFSQDYDDPQQQGTDDNNVKTDFRDELFVESDSSVAFASTSSSSHCHDRHEQQRDRQDGLLNINNYNAFLENTGNHDTTADHHTTTGNHALPPNVNFVGVSENSFMLGNTSTLPPNTYDSIEHQHQHQQQQQQPQQQQQQQQQQHQPQQQNHLPQQHQTQQHTLQQQKHPHSQNGWIRNNKQTHEPNARRKQQRRRRRNTIRKRNKRRKVPPHIRNANAKARAITGRFLGLLRAEVDKVMLFANSRMGELADTIGSLRFPSDYYPERRHGASTGGNDGGGFDDLGYTDDVGLHSSASSSSDDIMIRPSDDWSSSDEEEIHRSHRIRKDSCKKRQQQRRRQQQQQQNQNQNHHHRQPNNNNNNDINRSSKRHHRRNRSLENMMKRKNYALTAQQMQHNEQLRISRPMFQRSDQVVGEDFLLLSAVDEADAYAAIGIELMHLLKFLCVNVIAVRRVSKKHDMLLRSRMLGGYYKKHFRQSHSRQFTGSSDTNNFGNGTCDSKGIGRPPTTTPALGRRRNILHGKRTNLRKGFSFNLDPATGIDQVVLPELNRGRLVGLYDAMIQNLANSSTALIISESLALALSEFDDSRRRADALSGLGFIPTAASYNSMKSLEEEALCIHFPHPRTFGLSSLRMGNPRLVTTSANKMEDVWADREGDGSASTFAASGGGGNGSGNGDDPPSTSSSISLTRLRFVVASIVGLRDVARRKYEPFNDYLSRSMMALAASGGGTGTGNGTTTTEGGGSSYVGEAQGMEGCSRKTLDFFVDYNPDAAFFLDPHILRKCLVVADRNAVAASCLAVAADLEPLSDEEMEEDEEKGCNLYDGHNLDSMNVVLGSVAKRTNGTTSKQAIVRINALSAALSTMNYYIIVPSAASFCHSLGLKSTYSPILIGAASVTSLSAAIWHAQVISNNKTNNRAPLQYNLRIWLLLCAVLGLLGNILYSLAYYRWYLSFLGRLVVGLSSSEMISKHFVAATMSSDSVVEEMGILRKAHMKGMTLGVFCGAVFELVDGEKDIVFGNNFAFVFHFKTMPGYFMSMLWVVQIILLLCAKDVNGLSSFNNPVGGDDNDDDGGGGGDALYNKSPSASFSRSQYSYEISSISGLQSLLLVQDTSERSIAESIDSRNQNSEILTSKPKKRSLTSTLKRMRKLIFLNNSLPVTLVLLLFSSITIEIIFSSCAIITHRYFRWSGSSAGFFLLILTSMIYPIYRITAYWSRCRDERTVMKKSLVAVLVGIIIFVNYGELVRLFLEARHILSQETEPYAELRTKYDWRFGRVQYCVGVAAMFICCIALEGVTLSLMSKVSPSRLNVSPFNCSLLVPLFICLGRVIGDAILLTVAFSHRVINTDMVNSISLYVLCLCWPCLHLVKKHYFFLNGS